jgi:hypothetical protein
MNSGSASVCDAAISRSSDCASRQHARARISCVCRLQARPPNGHHGVQLWRLTMAHRHGGGRTPACRAAACKGGNTTWLMHDASPVHAGAGGRVKHGQHTFSWEAT